MTNLAIQASKPVSGWKRVRLADVKAEDFDTIFYPGGHGPMWDLAEGPGVHRSARIVLQLREANCIGLPLS
jgi:putative intracellular protease/amidase